jgi:hypothetical protein
MDTAVKHIKKFKRNIEKQAHSNQLIKKRIYGSRSDIFKDENELLRSFW